MSYILENVHDLYSRITISLHTGYEFADWSHLRSCGRLLWKR